MNTCLSDFAAVKTENATVFHGSNLDVLPFMADNSVDSIVTDPPYELGFMGKSWDSSGIAYSVELWRECLRVLKPGGHLLAFGGSRTWHRLAVAIEDAGFELRDSIAWLYGSGFPKSLDVSKAIDKQDATEARAKRNLAFTTWMRSTDLTRQKATDLLREAGVISENGTMAGHFFAETMAGQPAVATAELFDVLRPYLPEVPDYIEAMVAERTIESENFKKREVIGQKTTNLTPYQNIGGDNISGQVDVTLAATDDAKKWAGWGTALKPAFEPVVVARKPLIGTVAENVLEWGVGGLNIDASRIGTETIISRGGRSGAVTGDERIGAALGMYGAHEPLNTEHQGRWPANIILDEYTTELLDEQSGVTSSKSTLRPDNSTGRSGGIMGAVVERSDIGQPMGHNDSGGASRFFYVAKASKRDRNEGLDELETKQTIGGGGLTEIGGAYGSIKSPAKNFHPTVKPTELMRYLIKLVTPAGGIVLDPFTGSGSTGKAALLNGYQFLGIELTPDYLPIIKGRLEWAETEALRAADEENEKLF